MPQFNNHAVEESTFAITAAFYDSQNNAVTPSNATWSLMDTTGNFCNNRNAVIISPLGTSANITLTGADLASKNNEYGDVFKRKLLLEAVYTSDEGAGLTLKSEIDLYIDNLLGV